MENKEAKTIYCPRCGRKVGTYDGKSTVHKIVKCKKCNKLVVYNVDTGKIKVTNIPERNCSSGIIKY